jgi:hypothetical protein
MPPPVADHQGAELEDAAPEQPPAVPERRPERPAPAPAAKPRAAVSAVERLLQQSKNTN